MPTFREEAAERVAPLLAPIPGANPAGADISYDADFEAIKAEIDKLSSIDAAEPQWSKVEQLAKSLLAQKGKDLRVASWMTVAKTKTSSWKGFADSLVLCHGLASSFWDTMFPEARRARARVNAIAWMTDMVGQQMQTKDVSLADGDAVRACDEVLNELDQLLADKLGDAYSGPGMLRSILRSKVQAIPVPPPVVSADAGAPAASVETPVEAPTAPAAPTSPEEVDAALEANSRIICDCAALLRGADPTSAWAYALQRRGAWLIVQQAPPAEDGRTVIPSPDGALMSELAEMCDSARWSDLLAAGEVQTSNYLFWLDVHRYVALALENLGGEYLAAREAVGREVAAYVRNMPELPSLAFSDGTPFADRATQEWLAEELPKHGAGGGPSAAAVAVSAEDEEIAKRFEEAKTLVEGGKIADGLALGIALADRAADARLRFRARLSVGKMALDAQKPDLARGMFEHLMGDVDRHGLETWEPATCATLYSHLYVATRDVSRAKGGAPELEGRMEQLFDKLCRLDPASAIKLST